MRSRSVTIRVPQVLYDAALELSKREGYKNGSFNALVVGLIRFTLLANRSHSVTVEIDGQPREEQDAIDDEIVRAFRAGESLKGSWFEKLLQESVEAVADGKDIPENRIVRELLRRIGK